jgi:hypothetical protein
MARHSMGRQAIVTADEQDAYTGWRKIYCYLHRAGVVKAIKRDTHRRVRREARAEIRREMA